MDSEDEYDDDELLKPVENEFQKEIRQKKEELGKFFAHPAFEGKNSLAYRFVSLKHKDPDAKIFVPGSYVWVPDRDNLFVPAKVVERIEFSQVLNEAKKREAKRGQEALKTGNLHNASNVIKRANAAFKNAVPEEHAGRVVTQSGNKIVLLTVSQRAAANLLPLDKSHLSPSGVMDLYSVGLSPASLLYFLRQNFVNKEVSTFMIGEKTLVYVNRFISMEQEMMRKMEKKMALMNAAQSNDEPKSEEPEVNVDTLADKVYNNLNANRGEQPQSCIITGNKDSNRREVSRSFSRRVVQLSNPRDASWFEKLQAADEVLSVFGGENFLRWTELHMNYKDGDKGKLVGAAFQSFMLDTSNLINKDTKAFDIFHQLCSAALYGNTTEQNEQKVDDMFGILSPSASTQFDFLNGLHTLFGLKEESAYYYLNKGQEPRYRFTKEEVEEYFEDPEVKRKRLLKEKQEEEKRRMLEEEKRLAEESMKAKSKKKRAKLEKNARIRDEEERKQRALEARLNKTMPRKPRAVGKADRNKYLQSMEATNQKHTLKNKRCAEQGCDKKVMGSEAFCMTHFVAQSRSLNANSTVVAAGQASGAVSEERHSPQSAADRARKTIKGSSQFAEVANVVKEEELTREKEQLKKKQAEEEEERKRKEEREQKRAQQKKQNETLKRAAQKWQKTLESLRLINISDEEIGSMINVLKDILEFGNIQVCNTERTTVKKKIAQIAEKFEDNFKEEELIEKKIDADAIYEGRDEVIRKKKSRNKQVPEVVEPNDGKSAIEDVAIDFLVEKKILKEDIFGVSLLDLVSVLNVRKLKFGSEEILKPLSRNKSLARRDAMVRALYAGMFSWLLSVVNKNISFTSGAKNAAEVDEQIGIIAVLESVGLVTELTRQNSNSLEQLMNNYAQEKLHSFETIHILEKSAEVYKEEGLSIPFPEGNELVLPLILGQTVGLEDEVAEKSKKLKRQNRSSFQRTVVAMSDKLRQSSSSFSINSTGKFAKSKRTLGILDICEEQFRAPKGNDKNLLERIMKEHSRHENMLISNNRYAFKIKHFGAKVNYHVKGFVSKAWSSVLDEEILTFMVNNTENNLVRLLLTKHSIETEQKNLERVYNSGIERIKLGIVEEKLKERNMEFSAAPEGSLILSRHSVNFSNSRVARNASLPIKPIPLQKPKPRKGGLRASVSRGLTGMTTTLNYVGLMRARNVGTPQRTQRRSAGTPTMQSMDIKSPINPSASMRSMQSVSKEGRATTSGGVRNVFNTMNTLIVMLDLTEPVFVHCIPANPKQKPDTLDVPFVFEQLKMSGIVPFFGKRFVEASFGKGIDFEHLKHKFKPLNFLMHPDNRAEPSSFFKCLQDFGCVPKDCWKVGISRSKVFVRSSAMTDIDALSNSAFEDLVVYIQKFWRMSLTRKLYFVLLEEKYIALLQKGTEKNDLRLLENTIGKCKFYKFAAKEVTIAEGKVKRLRVELRMRNELKKITDGGSITELFSVLRKAKDMQLPFCTELKQAIDRYNILNSRAEQAAKDARKILQKDMKVVMEELAEQQEFDRNFKIDEFIAEMKSTQIEMEAEKLQQEIEGNGEEEEEEDEFDKNFDLNGFMEEMKTNQVQNGELMVQKKSRVLKNKPLKKKPRRSAGSQLSRLNQNSQQIKRSNSKAKGRKRKGKAKKVDANQSQPQLEKFFEKSRVVRKSSQNKKNMNRHTVTFENFDIIKQQAKGLDEVREADVVGEVEAELDANRADPVAHTRSKKQLSITESLISESVGSHFEETEPSSSGRKVLNSMKAFNDLVKGKLKRKKKSDNNKPVVFDVYGKKQNTDQDFLATTEKKSNKKQKFKSLRKLASKIKKKMTKRGKKKEEKKKKKGSSQRQKSSQNRSRRQHRSSSGNSENHSLVKVEVKTKYQQQGAPKVNTITGKMKGSLRRLKGSLNYNKNRKNKSKNMKRERSRKEQKRQGKPKRMVSL